MRIETLKLSVTRCYLVQTGHGYVLIDTGYESDWPLFSRRLQQAGVRLSEISHVVLTHHHDDHCGLLNPITRANEAVRVVMSHRAPELLAAGHNDRAHETGWVSRRASWLIALLRKTKADFDRHWRAHEFPPYTRRESDVLIEGETNLEDIGIGLRGRIIETSGHTNDSISVLLEDGSCFVGDAAANLPALAGTRYCVILLEDIEEYYRSWDKLIRAGARRIFPAHGEPFSVERLRRHRGDIRRSDMVHYSPAGLAGP
ncbi:MAG TPA: MBL fold metallo-hydrolase [Polyangiaceae bacterium]|nr:MBL fold metallo-hydrolase [Polyangiaceae bacterium]